MENTVLLVVDVQTTLMNYHPYHEIEFIENIRKLTEVARKSDIAVVYIRHDDGKGTELECGTEGWEILNEVAPNGDEKIFDKHYNSAFKETGLKDYLDGKKIKNLILVGMQTEYCIDATCKVAFEHGYSLIIPAKATTTFNSSFSQAEALINFYEEKIWNGRFAELVSIDEAIEKMKLK